MIITTAHFGDHWKVTGSATAKIDVNIKPCVATGLFSYKKRLFSEFTTGLKSFLLPFREGTDKNQIK